MLTHLLGQRHFVSRRAGELLDLPQQVERLLLHFIQKVLVYGQLVGTPDGLGESGVHQPLKHGGVDQFLEHMMDGL